MPIFNIFLLLGVAALIISFFMKGRSAIWGGATLGLVIGLVYGLLKGDLSDILRFALIGADLGLLANILGWIGDRLKR